MKKTELVKSHQEYVAFSMYGIFFYDFIATNSWEAPVWPGMSYLDKGDHSRTLSRNLEAL